MPRRRAVLKDLLATTVAVGAAESRSATPGAPPGQDPDAAFVGRGSRGLAVLRTLVLGNSGPWMASLSPVYSNEVGNYSRRPTLALFLERRCRWLWQFAQAQIPQPNPLPACRLMIDGTPATDWVRPLTDKGVYAFDVVLTNGHHVAYVEAQGLVITCFAQPFVCNDTGAPLPRQEPWLATNRFTFGFKHLNAAVQLRYSAVTPATAPLKPRPTPRVAGATLNNDNAWVRHPAAHYQYGAMHRFAATPTGDVVVESEQKYFHDDAITQPRDKGPKTFPSTRRDGPQGVGTLANVTELLVRRGGGGVYFLESEGRLGVLGYDGTVLTVAGKRLRNGALKVHSGVLQHSYQNRHLKSHIDSYSAAFEDTSDWTQVKGPHQLWETWGFSLVMRNPDRSLETRDGHEGHIADTRNHRILYWDHWTAHRPNEFQRAHCPPAGYVQAPGPTGLTTMANFAGSHDGTPTAACNEPWQVKVNPVDGWVYWTNFQGNSIARCRLDGSGLQLVLQDPASPSDATLGIRERLGAPTIAPIELRHLVRDGPAATASCIRPTGFDFDSSGDLIFVEHYTYAVRKLELRTMTVTTLCYLSDRNGWSLYEPSITVDREGDMGFVDDMFAVAWWAKTDVRFTKQGQIREHYLFNSLPLANGPVRQSVRAQYVWAVGIGNGRLVAVGSAGGEQCCEIVSRLPSDPKVDLARWQRGRAAYVGSPLHLVCGPEGQGALGLPNNVALARMSEREFAAFLAPYGITGAAVDDLRYFVNWNVVDLQV